MEHENSSHTHIFCESPVGLLEKLDKHTHNVNNLTIFCVCVINARKYNKYAVLMDEITFILNPKGHSYGFCLRTFDAATFQQCFSFIPTFFFIITSILILTALTISMRIANFFRFINGTKTHNKNYI